MFFYFYDIITLGDVMKIAVDKNTYKVAKKDGNEYIYLFDNEPYQDLLKTKLHCLRYNKSEYVDINLTEFNIDCIKKTTPDEKDWNKIEHKNFKMLMKGVVHHLLSLPHSALQILTEWSVYA